MHNFYPYMCIWTYVKVSTRCYLGPNAYNCGALPSGSDGEGSACNAWDPGSIPGSGISPGERNGNSLQYSCLENSNMKSNSQELNYSCATVPWPLDSLLSLPRGLGSIPGWGTEIPQVMWCSNPTTTTKKNQTSELKSCSSPLPMVHVYTSFCQLL